MILKFIHLLMFLVLPSGSRKPTTSVTAATEEKRLQTNDFVTLENGTLTVPRGGVNRVTGKFVFFFTMSSSATQTLTQS